MVGMEGGKSGCEQEEGGGRPTWVRQNAFPTLEGEPESSQVHAGRGSRMRGHGAGARSRKNLLALVVPTKKVCWLPTNCGAGLVWAVQTTGGFKLGALSRTKALAPLVGQERVRLLPLRVRAICKASTTVLTEAELL